MSEQNQGQMSKDGLKVMALKQRIGELTSNYEDQLADLRAEATMQLQQMAEEINRLNSEKDTTTPVEPSDS